MASLAEYATECKKARYNKLKLQPTPFGSVICSLLCAFLLMKLLQFTHERKTLRSPF